EVSAQSMLSQIGSGALPVEQLPSFGLAVRAAPTCRAGNALGRLEQRLRALPAPVIGRIGQDTLWLDLRCLEAGHQDAFVRQLERLAP
ncbi:MAG TPA: L-seryl-tRNA(Sec) selenium transferase, partial [Janthinobacterium sp.]|nr:L-seryl-tRNA(Sec) selenium transferase [Janthinobacterium sp.]